MITVLSWTIVVLVIVSFWHFVWESIIAPSMRLEERLELFRLRDEVRRCMAEGDNENEESLLLIQESLNTGIDVMQYLTPSNVVRFQRDFETNKDLQERVAASQKIIFGSTSESVKRASKRIVQSVRRALLINSGGWAIFIVPIGLCMYLWSRITTICQAILAAAFSESSGGHGSTARIG